MAGTAAAISAIQKSTGASGLQLNRQTSFIQGLGDESNAPASMMLNMSLRKLHPEESWWETQLRAENPLANMDAVQASLEKARTLSMVNGGSEDMAKQTLFRMSGGKLSRQDIEESKGYSGLIAGMKAAKGVPIEDQLPKVEGKVGNIEIASSTMDQFSEKIGRAVVEGMTKAFKEFSQAAGSEWQRGARRSSDGSSPSDRQEAWGWKP